MHIISATTISHLLEASIVLAAEKINDDDRSTIQIRTSNKGHDMINHWVPREDGVLDLQFKKGAEYFSAVDTVIGGGAVLEVDELAAKQLLLLVHHRLRRAVLLVQVAEDRVDLPQAVLQLHRHRGTAEETAVIFASFLL